MVFHHIVLLHCNGQGPLHLNKDPPPKKNRDAINQWAKEDVRQLCALSVNWWRFVVICCERNIEGNMSVTCLSQSSGLVAYVTKCKSALPDAWDLEIG